MSIKKPIAIRIDAGVLEAARECARQDNRTLTNFIETALCQRIAAMVPLAPASTSELAGQKGGVRGV